MSTYSEAETRGVRVRVQSVYVADRSSPEDEHWFFAYQVNVSNEGDETVTLVSRHWIITDANGKVQEVNGDGVVGEQPHLDPGEEFEYSSGAVLETPVGAMQGLYRMVAEGGFKFDAPIAPFTLAVPGMLN